MTTLPFSLTDAATSTLATPTFVLSTTDAHSNVHTHADGLVSFPSSAVEPDNSNEKNPNRQKILYIGGLHEEIHEQQLYNLFIPFGEIERIFIPREGNSKKHRGFGFVEMELAEDCQGAIENLNHGELLGREITVNMARPTSIASQSVWAQNATQSSSTRNDVSI